MTPVPGGSTQPEVLYRTGGRVAHITMNRPAKRNALSWTAIGAIADRLAQAKADPEVGVVVLGGAGGLAFCAGVDLDELVGDASALDLHQGGVRVAQLFDQLWALGKPTIAAVRGFALAGGMGLALSCDFVVCSDDSIFGTPEIDVGLWPFMITVPLVRSMPPKKALELMLTGRRVGAAEAQQIGFVNQVVPPEDLDSVVTALAAGLADKPAAMVKLGRDSFYTVWDMRAADAFACLHPMLTVAAMSDEARERLSSRRGGAG